MAAWNQHRSGHSTGRLSPSVNLGRIRGIWVGLHYSWFFIAFLITLSLAGHFRQAHGDWAPATVWTLAIVTAVLFFITLLSHERSHALVARSHGLPVRFITLFALGGIATIERGAATARVEFLVAIVAPSPVLSSVSFASASPAPCDGRSPAAPAARPLLFSAGLDIQE